MPYQHKDGIWQHFVHSICHWIRIPWHVEMKLWQLDIARSQWNYVVHQTIAVMWQYAKMYLSAHSHH